MPGSCPGEEELLGFVSGRLPAEGAERVQAHARSCALCSARVEGETLRSWLGERPRTLDEILDVFIAAGRALAAAHVAGLQPGFTPDKVFIGRDGRVRVGHSALERSPPDLAPLDASAGLYSFCAALQDALDKSPGSAAGAPQALPLHQERGPVRAEARAVPGWLREILESGLRAEPSLRPPTMTALLDRLETARRAAVRAGRLRTRRQLAVVSSALALAALAAIGATRARLHARAACEEGARRIEGAWTPARKKQVGEAFHATRLVYAAAALSRVSEALDRFAAAWPEAYTTACQLGIGASEGGTQAGLRLACLSEQLASVQAKSELFAHADGKLVENAAAMASAIEDPAECARGTALRAPLPPAALRPAVERLRAGVARVKALGEADQLDEARALSQRLVKEASAIPFRPVLAEALLAQGEIAMDSYDPKGAIDAATDAAFVAEGSHHDVIAARAWTLALHEAAELAMFDKGRELEREARGALARIGGDDLLQAQLETAVGFLLTTVGKAEEALAMEVSARAHYQRTGRVDRFSSWLLNDEASALFVLGRYAESVDEFKRAAELKERLLGPSHPDVGSGLSNLGSALTALGDYPEAGAALARAHVIFERALPAGHVGFLALSVNEGDLALARGDAEGALAAYQHALDVAGQNGQLDAPNTLQARLGLGRAQLSLGRTREAIATLDQALLAEPRSVDPFVLAGLDFSLARGLRKMGRDPARARLLAAQARAAYLASGERGKAPLADLERWLAAEPP